MYRKIAFSFFKVPVKFRFPQALFYHSRCIKHLTFEIKNQSGISVLNFMSLKKTKNKTEHKRTPKNTDKTLKISKALLLSVLRYQIPTDFGNSCNTCSKLTCNNIKLTCTLEFLHL